VAHLQESSKFDVESCKQAVSDKLAASIGDQEKF
jgi:hypothetical protein